MGPIRKLLFVGVGVLALHGVQACTSETELNPQPLPPQPGEPGKTPEENADSREGQPTGAGGMSPAPSAADGGTEGGDAADGGPG